MESKLLAVPQRQGAMCNLTLGRFSSTGFTMINKFIKNILLIFLFIACLVVGMYFHQFHEGLSKDQNTWGTFGDYVGGILNPFIAFLAFLLLSESLKIQLSELELSRNELKKSSQALEEQGKILKQQKFENTFFHLLQLHHDIINKTSVVNLSGQKSFEYLYKDLVEEHRKADEYAKEQVKKLRIDEHNINKYKIVSAYTTLHGKHQHLLEPYFNNLFCVIKLIDEQSANEEDKEYYALITRSQLSKFELILTAYNCLYLKYRNELDKLEEILPFYSDLIVKPKLINKPEFFELIEKFQFLKGIEETFSLREEVMLLYPKNFSF